jgi:hypothetical protein
LFVFGSKMFSGVFGFEMSAGRAAGGIGSGSLNGVVISGLVGKAST